MWKSYFVKLLKSWLAVIKNQMVAQCRALSLQIALTNLQNHLIVLIVFQISFTNRLLLFFTHNYYMHYLLFVFVAKTNSIHFAFFNLNFHSPFAFYLNTKLFIVAKLQNHEKHTPKKQQPKTHQ